MPSFSYERYKGNAVDMFGGSRQRYQHSTYPTMFLLIFQEHTHTHTHNWHIYSNWFSRNNAEKFFFAVLHACHESHKYLNCNRSNYPQLPSHQSKRQQTPCRYKWFIALSHSCWCCWCLFFCSLISRLSLYRDNKAKQTKMHGDESFSNWK